MVELIWGGKYDNLEKRAAPISVALPFQTIETLNESTQQRQKSIETFLSGRGETDWRNRLIWGDKKYVLPSLLPEFSDSVDLIYIDPPFDTGADFSYLVEVPDHQTETISFTKLPSIIEQKAYRDTWGGSQTHLDSYLHWFHDTVHFLAKLLKSTGSIYVHLDYHVSHYAKAILDEVLGPENFLNEIVWKRTAAHSGEGVIRKYGPIHDSLLLYGKSESYTFNPGYLPYTQDYLDNFYRNVDPDGRRWLSRDLTAAGIRHGDSGKPWHGIDVAAKGTHWKFTIQRLDELEKKGRIYFPQKEGGMPRYKQYLDESKGVLLQDIWTDIGPVQAHALERLAYPTQKPERLLERIVKTSSNEGDLVLDCFCGSGTLPAVAQKLNRRWIAGDLSRFAIHTTRKRLLEIEGVRPFVIQNLGKYERQLWQTSEFGEDAQARISAYTNFILRLYSAEPLKGYFWLHGVKGKRLVHIGSVDSPVSPLDVGQMVAEFKRSVGSGKDAPKTNGVDVLGWDFAFELNEIAKQQAAQANVDLRFLRIPREVLDKRAVEQGDVRFFELGSLNVDAKSSARKVAVTIRDFVIPVDDVPADVQKNIKHWSQWIDYWAVDWNFRGDTFHNEWQEYRTQDKPELAVESSRRYDEPGRYQIVVKVIDILGNDTTKTLSVNIT